MVFGLKRQQCFGDKIDPAIFSIACQQINVMFSLGLSPFLRLLKAPTGLEKNMTPKREKIFE